MKYLFFSLMSVFLFQNASAAASLVYSCELHDKSHSPLGNVEPTIVDFVVGDLIESPMKSPETLAANVSYHDDNMRYTIQTLVNPAVQRNYYWALNSVPGTDRPTEVEYLIGTVDIKYYSGDEDLMKKAFKVFIPLNYESYSMEVAAADYIFSGKSNFSTVLVDARKPNKFTYTTGFVQTDYGNMKADLICKGFAK